MARIVELVGWAFFAGFVLLIALVFFAVTWGGRRRCPAWTTGLQP